MFLVIVGAGASYDCSQLDWHLRPHLAKDLFDDRPINLGAMQRFPVVRPIIGELRELVKEGASTIEAELARITREAEKNEARKRQLMALRFYLQYIIREVRGSVLSNHGGMTSYVPLVSELQRWQNNKKEPICVVDFNYDGLLEQGLSDAGINWEVRDFSDYVNRDDFIVIKPHGSIDWSRWVTRRNPGESYDPIKNAQEINLEETEIHLESDGIEDGFVPVPAVAVPVIGKYSFECPQELIDILTQLLPKTDKVLTLGWRAAEEHFKPMLETIKNEISLTIVTATEEGSAEVLAKLDFLKTQRVIRYNRGFFNFVRSDEFSQFLN